MNDRYQTYIADEHIELAWNQYLKQHPTNPGLNCFAWQRVLAEKYRPLQRHFYVKNNLNQIVGILPTYITTTIKGHKQLFSSRQGMLANNDAVATLLIHEAKKFAKEHSVIKAEIASGVQQYDVAAARYTRDTIRIDLTVNMNDLWKKMRDKTRNAIRKGEKHHLSIQQGKNLLSQFYHMYSQRMVKKSVLLLSFDFFKALMKHFNDQCEVYLAFKENQPIAGMLIVYFGSTAVYAYGGMLPGYEHYCPNQYLLWHIVKNCYMKNIMMLDLGESSVGSGVYKFKTWFGGEPQAVYYYDLLKPMHQSTRVNSSTNTLSTVEKSYHIFMKHAPIWLKAPVLKKLKQYGRLI